MKFSKSCSYFVILFICMFVSFPVISQQDNSYRSTLKGTVTDFYTAKPLFGVTVYFKTIDKGVVTDAEGKFSITVPNGRYIVEFSRAELVKKTITVDLVEDKVVNVDMKENVFNLDEVAVFFNKADDNVKNLDVGRNDLSIEKLQSIPAFMGETDVVKSLILLPGVSTVGEGSSGFNVRGGGVDQNLILQDGGLIFNPSHFFGFFSIFNPALVENATLIKNGLPAKYGGRLSSVLDVELKEGDFKEFGVSGSAGIVTSKLAVEGPIIKDKLSFIVGGRISYADWLLNLAEDPNVSNSTAGFHDANVKLTYRVNDKNKLSYSGYLSEDDFAFASDTAFSWKTTNHVLKWTNIINDKLVLDFDGAIGEYSYSISDDEGINAFEVNSKINYNKVLFDFDYDINSNNTLNFGAEGIYYQFQPGEQNPLGEQSVIEKLKVEEERALEAGVFIEDEFKVTKSLSIRAGLRYSFFTNLGEGTEYLYGPNDSRNIENITDTITFSKNEQIATYHGPEPRLNLNYTINKKSSIKASYNRTRQYIHLITNTTSVTPTDNWKTSNYYIPPEVADQYSIGYFRNFSENTIEASIETYYKTADNIVDVKDGAVLLMNENVETELINGKSESYGVELFVNKKLGKFTGWFSYTYARTFRIVEGEFEDETINYGRKYPANYDKPHDVTFAFNYKQSPIVDFAANFTYSSGRPATVPLSLYDVDNLTNIYNFSLRNQDRIPDYHRLDLSMTIKSKPKVDRRWKTSWTLSVYNVYARKNAYSVFYKNEYGSPPKAYKLSVLGSAFPSLMVNFDF